MSDHTPALPLRGYLLVIVAATLWAVSGSSGKFLFRQGMSPQDLVQIRVTVAAAAVFLWFLVKDRSRLRIELKDIPYFIILGTTGMAMVQFTYFYTISKIPVAVAILLEYLAPSFIAIYSIVVLREKPSGATLAAVAGATIGCYLAVGAYNFDIVSLNWQGIAVGILSGVCFAWYTIMCEYGMRKYNPWTVLFYALLLSTIMWNVVFTPLKGFRQSFGLFEWGLVAYISLFGTAIPFGLYTAGINYIRSTRASITATLEPILAGCIAFAFLGESLQVPQMAGGALVIASVVMLQLKRERDANTPELIRARGGRVPSGSEGGSAGHS